MTNLNLEQFPGRVVQWVGLRVINGDLVFRCEQIIAWVLMYLKIQVKRDAVLSLGLCAHGIMLNGFG